MKIFTKSTICTTLLSLAAVGVTVAQTKPEVNVGLLLHTYATAQQDGFGQSTAVSDASDWSVGASLYRARLLFDAKLSDKDYIFIETDLTASVGLGADKMASMRILDAQYDHTFGSFLTVSAGKILVSYNRNGLQTAGTLMANDFSYYQYAYNMSESSPLQNDCGRDVGVNLSGAIVVDKLKYKLGAFAGRRDFATDISPVRLVGRLQYNFWDDDKYSGTNLGEGETLTVAAGFDTQGTYIAGGLDAYLDMPLGAAGSITANAAYSYMEGGADFVGDYAIPEQSVVFAELGYYFKEVKLQPWVKYELQDIKSASASDDTVIGGGLNYFFNGYGSNVRVSYVGRQSSLVDKMYGQVWLQLQLFIF